MLDAGCVTAINLDGGGSTCYMSKEEGSDSMLSVDALSKTLVSISTTCTHGNCEEDLTYPAVTTADGYAVASALSIASIT